ncbi:MAG TPA: SMI1/KNR4 family protein [Gemmataceae bacterium]|nr:SMI1/KNR4 family protein [Gemmataceae bacterium]
MPTTLMTVADAWSRIDAWLRANAPENFRLPPGASEKEIEAAEKILGCRLPADVHESYRIHDGSNRIWLFRQGFLMPLGGAASEAADFSIVGIWTGMLQCAEMMKDERGSPKGPIKTDWWNLGWIPLTENDCGDYICIDMVPESPGQVGQVIDWWHEQAATDVLAPSWREWLADLVTRLEAGAYRFDSAGSGAVQPTQK